MRIAIGQISHETNTFCRAETDVAAFKALSWLHGDEIVRRHQGVRTDTGGMIEAGHRLGVQIVPVFSATAEPSGVIAAAAYAEMREELLDGLRRAAPFDAVCLSLHGAGVAADVDDLEGDLLSRVSNQVGPAVPIVVTLDLHGNITPAMAEHADLLLGCNFYPHVDDFERGCEAVERAVQLARREIQVSASLVRLPMMITASPTDAPAARAINEACWRWEARPSVLDCTFFHGFPYTDLPHVGVSIYAATDNDPARARHAAGDVSSQLWNRRATFEPVLVPPDAAIARAQAVPSGPVVINESADNPGGGAPGDGTHLLRALLAANLSEACFGFIADPETAAQAHAAGVGATIPVRLGGKTDDLHGAPIVADAYVNVLTDGRFTLSTPMGRGMPMDLGPCARLTIGGIEVIVASVRTQTLDPEVFLLHGIDVTRFKIVALKSSAHFRAGFVDLATEIVTCDTPGLISRDLTTMPYQRLARPIWPLDQDLEPAPLAIDA